MLKYMTKEAFIKAVDESRFVVVGKTDTKYEVYLITASEEPNGTIRHGMLRVVNPDTKDGNFRQTGGGYNKSHACIDAIAFYVNRNARDKDEVDTNCVDYFQKKQRLNSI